MLEARPYSSREFIYEIGKWLHNGKAVKKDSLIQTCYECGVPIFVPAFSDSSAGFGIGKHQWERMQKGEKYLSIDSYTQSQQLIMQSGCIGHLSANFGSDNKHFNTSWDDHRADLKSGDFEHEFEEVIKALREDDKYGAVFKNRGALPLQPNPGIQFRK